MLEIECKNVSETRRLAKCLRDVLASPVVVFLYGELGAGKTTLIRFILEGLIDQRVSSSSFTLIRRYSGKGGVFWHLDLYRVQDPVQVWELGLEDVLKGGIVFIEWADRFPLSAEALRKEFGVKVVEIEIRFGANESRLFKIKGDFAHQIRRCLGDSGD